MIVTLSDEDKDSPNISFLRQCIVDSISNNTINILCKGELAKNYIEQNITTDINDVSRYSIYLCLFTNISTMSTKSKGAIPNGKIIC